jgi:N-acetylglucosaminylphosphatidylinositol deacetylase
MYDRLLRYTALTRYGSYVLCEPTCTNDTIQIFTFDDNGVSSHPNHISLYHGAKHLIRTLSHVDPSKSKPKPKSPPPKVPRLFTLRSVNLPNKYSGAFGALLTRAHISTCILHRLASPPDWPLAPRIGDMLGCPTREYATFVSNFRGYIVALVAMLTHRSQMVWFRWLYVGWSRYMWVNDWVEVEV